MEREIIFARPSTWPTGRGWKAERCDNENCPEHHRSLSGMDGKYIRVHPVLSEMFLVWEEQGARPEDIPDVALVRF